MFKLPDVFGEWSPITKCLINSVIGAGEAVSLLPRNFEVKSGEGHRSGITKGDTVSQEMLVDSLLPFVPGARILSEEMPSSFRENPDKIIQGGPHFVIDPLDSTCRYGRDLGGWCVMGGVIHTGNIVAGAIFAPATNAGLLIAAERHRGVVTADWGGEHLNHRGHSSYSYKSAKESVVLLGVDTFLYENINRLKCIIAPNVRGMFTSGSGGLGLGLVACGRAQVIIQTPQKVWDWVPGYRAVLEGGGVFYFFRLINGVLVPVEAYDLHAFKTLSGNNENRLGFVAGQPDIADRIFNLLPTTGWERIDPDTASGIW